MTRSRSRRRRACGPPAIPSLKLRQNVEWIERETIRRALELSTAKGDAARLMGISPRALSYYLAKYQLIDQKKGATPMSSRAEAVDVDELVPCSKCELEGGLEDYCGWRGPGRDWALRTGISTWPLRHPPSAMVIRDATTSPVTEPVA